MKHEFKEIEPKWQRKWEEAHVFHAENDYTKPKYYALVEFPYPSGQGLHVGHPRSYTALDIVARKRRMQGYNVLYPMGCAQCQALFSLYYPRYLRYGYRLCCGECPAQDAGRKA